MSYGIQIKVTIDHDSIQLTVALLHT